MVLEKISFINKKCSELTNEEICQCSKLFSDHYGLWGKDGPKGREGKKIKLSPKYYEDLKCLDHYVSMAFDDNELIGHAFYIRKKIDGFGYSSWVLQIVVHSDYRRQKIGRTLLYSIWGFSDDKLWGLATANPFTVKTLESATFRKVSPNEIKKHLKEIKILGQDIKFVKEYKVDEENSLVLTNFFPDISEIDNDIKSYNGGWQLGSLLSGYEWLAFTFQDQPTDKIPKDKLNDLMTFSEKQLKEAYGRMKIPEHSWAMHANHEVEWIINKLGLEGNELIIDFGCGSGRHILEFSKLGYNTVGIDFVHSNIECAKRTADHRNLTNIVFIEDDCRTIVIPDKKYFDVAICVYDVIGSFPDEDDNLKVLKNIYNHLYSGGYAVISVMNMELTLHKARYKADIKENPDILYHLKPSNTMQSCGDIFDPEYYVIDEKTNLVYRKEQFHSDGYISVEYVIRDKRYTAEEICKLAKNAGFKVIDHYFVQAGKWDISLQNNDLNAKEILVFLEK